MEAVVEFQGFKDNYNRFIVKELAVVSEHFQSHIVFKPPYGLNVLNEKARKAVRWLERQFHLIGWDEGGIPYDEGLVRNLLKPFLIVHTKGLEKAEFLREFHPKVEVIDDKVEIRDCTVDCFLFQHNAKDGKCALRSAVGYYDAINLEVW